MLASEFVSNRLFVGFCSLKDLRVFFVCSCCALFSVSRLHACVYPIESFRCQSSGARAHIFLYLGYLEARAHFRTARFFKRAAKRHTSCATHFCRNLSIIFFTLSPRVHRWSRALWRRNCEVTRGVSAHVEGGKGELAWASVVF